MWRPGENPTFDGLVSALLHQFQGLDDVRAVGRQGLTEPERFGSCRPEVTAMSHGRRLIGVAKTCEQLRDVGLVSELQDAMAARGPDGEAPVIWMAVPTECAHHAHAAIAAAGPLDPSLVEVLKVTFPGSTGRRP